MVCFDKTYSKLNKNENPFLKYKILDYIVNLANMELNKNNYYNN